MFPTDVIVKLTAVAALLVSAVGCAGAKTEIVADGARYPVSMSRAVRDWDGSLVTTDKREVVGKLQMEPRAWGTLYTLVDLNPKTDISRELNSQVEQHNGQAVVNLMIVAHNCGLNYAYPLTHIPFWPGCVDVTITGDIIRVKRPPQSLPVTSVAAREEGAR